jgi:hypothetical protein
LYFGLSMDIYIPSFLYWGLSILRTTDYDWYTKTFIIYFFLLTLAQSYQKYTRTTVNAQGRPEFGN